MQATAVQGGRLLSAAVQRGGGSDLIYAGSRGVFTWNRGDAQGSVKMDYVNSDRNITDTKALVELDETHFVMFYREDNAPELKAGIFSYVKPEDIPDRAVVVLGGLSVNGGVRKRVVQYNRDSSQYRVVLKEYASAEDLNLDIVSGRMPDILMAKGLPMRSYIAKGLIADVGTLLEGDGELSRAQFLENVFDAYSVDGKLRYIVPSVTLSTMTATPYADAYVLNIVREELGSYFSGQKTAEDVATIIQNRVQMYVQENQ
ncbi:MAG: hypothetical protein NC543_09605 [bacterium]|nr:hypothetical protein [bacterium]